MKCTSVTHCTDAPSQDIDYEVTGVDFLPRLFADLGHSPVTRHHLSQHLGNLPCRQFVWGSIVAIVEFQKANLVLQ